MKKSLILSIVLLICGSVAYSQNSKSFYKSSYETRNSGSWDKESMILSFGLGFPNVAVGYGGLNGFPPIYAKFEHGFLRDEVGLGGYISTGFGSFKYTGNEKTNFTAFSVGFLGYYHFNKLIPIEKMDVYAGAGLGFRNVSYSSDDIYFDDSNDFQVTGQIKVGIRYYVKPALAFYAESGYDGMSSINLGVTLKLK
ncbi:MAG: hypothetical protein ABI663_04940 [Chryseolinea sp.]